jgi:hypothetical protein
MAYFLAKRCKFCRDSGASTSKNLKKLQQKRGLKQVIR